MSRTLFLCGAAVIACLLPIRAQALAFPVVAPTSAATTEAGAGTAIPFGSTAARHVQYAYDGAAVGYAAPMRLGGIELRADGTALGTSVQGTYSFTLSCSTCAHAADALALTFAANHGADRTTVRSGTLVVPAPATGQQPNEFSLRIPFTTPFEWDPRNGPLLLDFAYNAATPAFGSWDAVNASSQSGGILASGSSAATATAVATVVPVVRLLAAAEVAPAGSATAEGDTNTSFPWNRTAGSGMRTLTLYEAPALPFTRRELVTALAWRTDAGLAFGGRTYDVLISMSTSPLAAATLSTTFDQDHGSDRTVVFDGTLVCAATPASTDLGQFDVLCELQRPFEYDPARGGLVVDVQLRNATGAGGANFDCVSGGSGVGRVSNSTSATSATGSSVQNGVALVMAMRCVPVPVLPAVLANSVNPGSSSAFPFGSAPCRTLNMLSAAAAGITAVTQVRSLRFRPQSTAFGPTTYTCTIDLSNPSNTPATIVTTFDQNHGANRVRVFDDQFSVPFGTRSATDTAFPIEVKLQRPFTWDPVAHPYLCVDFAVTNRVGSPIQAETTFNLTVDDARLTASSATATTGTPQPIALLMQIGGEQANGLAVNYGAGCPGTNGAPVCTTVGLPCLPNPDFRIRLRNGPGNALAFLTVGLGAATVPLQGAPGCNLLHDVALGTFGIAITDPSGDGSFPLPLLGGAVFDGLRIRAQWVALDAAANAAGLSTSDAETLTLRFF
ncbi:MAG: hypothetical protein U1E73_10960 [Planctomycetota bacterium]